MSTDRRNGTDTTSSEQNPFAAPNPAASSDVLPASLSADTTMVTRYTLSVEYFRQAYDRFRQQQSPKGQSISGNLVVAVFLFILAVILFSQQRIVTATLLAILCVFFLIGPWIARRQAGKMFRSSPILDSELKCTLSLDGFSSRSSLQHCHNSWKLYVRFVSFDDGILLLQGPAVYQWVPFSGFDGSVTPTQIVTLVAGQIEDHDDRRTAPVY